MPAPPPLSDPAIVSAIDVIARSPSVLVILGIYDGGGVTEIAS